MKMRKKKDNKILIFLFFLFLLMFFLSSLLNQKYLRLKGELMEKGERVKELHKRNMVLKKELEVLERKSASALEEKEAIREVAFK